VQLNLARTRFGPPSQFPTLARALSQRLGLGLWPPSLKDLPLLTEALGRASFLDEELPHLSGELGAWLGDALCQGRACTWHSAEDPELGPFAYQASFVLLPQPGQAPLQLNVFSVALRAARDPQELTRFLAELDQAVASA
jgi:hypothetical protein